MPFIIITISNLSPHPGRLTVGGIEEEKSTVMPKGPLEGEGGMGAVAVPMEGLVVQGVVRVVVVATRTITLPEGEEVGGVGEAVEGMEGGACMTVGVTPSTAGSYR
jgi:hypothetical protein